MNAKAKDRPPSQALPVLHRVGRSIFDPIWAQQQHVDQRSELLHVLHGQVRVETPHYMMIGREGDTLYTPAGMPHKDVFPPGSVFEPYLVQFEWPGEAALLRQFTPPQLCMRRADWPAMANEFDELHREFLAELPYHRELASLRLLQIIYRLCRGAGAGSDSASEAAARSTRRAEIMQRTKQVIAEKCHDPISLDDIAAAVEVSPYYISRIFSSESGFTLSDYLTRMHMEKAVTLLKDRKLPIKDVARAVGYRDSHYFARVFRSHYQVSPSAYRSRESR